MASSNLKPVSTDSIRIGQPQAYPILNAYGKVLIPKGYVINSRTELIVLLGRDEPHIHAMDSSAHTQAYRVMLKKLMERNMPLGSIRDAYMKEDEEDATPISVKSRLAPPSWLDLQDLSNSILRDCRPPVFLQRLQELYEHLRQYSVKNPDGALLALLYLSTSETRLYSATHAMLVSVICGIAAREVLRWSLQDEQILCLAALTMNVGMTDLQDVLAKQPVPPTPSQREMIKEHPRHSVQLLRLAGVTDETWLQAVAMHHTAPPGPLKLRPLGESMARLIHRADIYSARRSPRTMRAPASAASAMQACYFDENMLQDEAGAIIIKAVGIHAPGSYVTLANGETAIVIKRGLNTAMPKVAAIISRDSMPLAVPQVRNTAQQAFRITGSVPSHEVKIRLNLQKMLALAASAA